MNIVFYTGYHHTPWDPTTPGLGGSETAVVGVAKRLANLPNNDLNDMQIYVVGDRVTSATFDNVTYVPTNEAHESLSGVDVDVLIGINYIHFMEEMEFLQAKQHIFWLHNMEHFPYYMGEIMDDNGDYVYNDPRLSAVVCVSDWQATHVAKTYPAIANKIRVIGNGINTVEEYPSDNIAIIPKRFIYTSAADRGLDTVLELWPAIKSKYMDAELVVCTPSYAIGDYNARMHAMEMLGVTIKGSLSKQDLYREMVKSEFWIYPTTYDETFCITALEMLYGSCIPLTTDAGNLKSLIQDNDCGFVTSHTLPHDEFKAEFMLNVDRALHMSETEKYELREKNWDLAEELTWANKGDEWFDMLKPKTVEQLIERILIISLDPGNPEKVQRWNDQLEKAGLGHIPAELILGINGSGIDEQYVKDRDIKLFPWAIESDNDWWTRNMKPGEVGCALSHIGAWNLIKDRQLTSALILEDDFECLRPISNQVAGSVPFNWDMLYLGRNPLQPDVDQVNDCIVIPGASYNLHAYALSSYGAQKLLDQNIRNNMMPVDEYIIGTYATHPREDLAFIWRDSIVYAVAEDIFAQTSYEEISSTEHIDMIDVSGPLPPLSNKFERNTESVEVVESPPTPVKNPMVGTMGPTTSNVEPASQSAQSQSSKHSVLYPELFEYFEDRELWWNRFLQPGVVTKEWGLLYDEPFDGVACLPFFNDVFCRMIAEEAENLNQWTVDRHEFYPTTDILIEKLGFNDIFNDLLREFVMPLSVFHYELEGDGWDNMQCENFLARYNTEAQGQLAIHHDASDISALVNLSEPDVDFTGGGTWFHRQKKLYRPMRGSLSIHPGNITHKHGARPVLSGKRYIMVSFMSNRHKN